MTTFENDELRYTKHNGHTDAAPVVVTYPYSNKAFNEGRVFRSFRELSGSEMFTIEATVPVDVILTAVNINLISGECRLETVAGGTPSGTFDTELAIFNQNNMSTVAPYTRQVDLYEGGSHTGGTLLDILLAKTSGSSNHASNVSTTQMGMRGVAVGGYYFRMTTTNGTSGLLSFQWEEIP